MTAEEYIKHYTSGQGGFESVSVDVALQAIKYAKQEAREEMMKDAFVFESKHNIACCLASECLRNHGWFGRERDFNNLWKFICGVKELFSGEFKTDDKVKIIIIKEG